VGILLRDLETPDACRSFLCLSGLETDRLWTQYSAMGALEKWTEVLRCPHCTLTGTADLAQKAHGIVQTLRLPAGFKIVSTEYGDTFYCKACNRPARTTLK
jgi:hypothetical protein